MKKALIVTTVSPTITSFLIPSIDLLINKGYKVEVATNILDGSFRQKIPEEVVINHIPFSRNIKSLDNIKAYFKMKKLLNKNKYSLIHTHTPIASFLSRKDSVKNENIIY
ncbi:glycosyltransferase family 1 protein, partial [Bacillus cereus]|uniref:glycosyltransferase n=1 Tax=Bacillus cereus TaxID=1396 RepID=UPI002ABF5F07